MCGICGIVNFNNQPSNVAALHLMMSKMKHRGPDDEGTFTEDNVTLGFVRLSIIDLSLAGHQPMISSDNRYVMVFNGEIYNYIELRDDLEKEGVIFRTRTDSEVLLNAYIKWGEECLNRFNGMWALVIFDRVEKFLFAARDRFGVKPFYYYHDSSRFIFASEIPPILFQLGYKPKPNNQVIFDFLVFNRTDQNEKTFFEQINKLQHGQIMHLSVVTGKVDIKNWYDLRSSLKEPFKTPEEYREAFSSAIRLRLRSDVPVGVCLSGGLDSSSIVSILLRDFKKSDLSTFSAVYNKGEYGDESDYIDQYRDQIQNMFFTTPTSDTFYSDFKHFIRAHAEPIPSTAPYSQYKVMELAKNNGVVTLDGQASDEELAGYHYFFGIFFKDLLLRGKIFLLFKEILCYLKNHRSLIGLKSFVFFLLPKKLRTATRVSEKGYIKKDFIKSYSKDNTISGNLYASRNLKEALLDHFEYKLEHLLKWEDRNSMWFSLEARIPFLDYRLVERTLALNATDIIKNGTTKHILRQAMIGRLPEKIRTRKDKIGFDNPQAEWFRSKSFQILITEILCSEKFANRNIIDPDKAMKLYQKHIKKKTDCSKEIWKWIHLELWFREFID